MDAEREYSVWSNFKFVFTTAWSIDKSMVWLSALQIPVLVGIPILMTYLSSSVIGLLMAQSSWQTLLITICGLSAALLVLNILNCIFEARLEWRPMMNQLGYLKMIYRKVMYTDYEHVENPAIMNRLKRAIDNNGRNEAPTRILFRQATQVFSALFGVVTCSALIFSFNPWLVLILLALTSADYLFRMQSIKWEKKNEANWIPHDRKMNYIKAKSGDFSVAKDIRLYGVSKWMTDIFRDELERMIFWMKKKHKFSSLMGFLMGITVFLRTAATFGLLIYGLVLGTITAAEFVLFFGLIGQYSIWIMNVPQGYSDLFEASVRVGRVRDFLDIADVSNRKKGVDLPKDSPDITFDEVSYRYPSNAIPTIENLNLTIKKGEKIAIVGCNGAGKTTLVKLLCGLYRPTEGRILIGGVPVSEFNIEDYFSLFSVAFQETYILPISVAKSVAQCPEEEIDYKRLKYVLKLAGLYDRVQELPQKENTLLVKSIFDSAVELSGGEIQKLSLARALYRDGLVIVLDEPTAALDPIAENEMYLRYYELTQGKTSIFISHRLSSTRFCDRILFIDKGEIVESGSHESLMQQGGQYAEMFEMQSHYYREKQREALYEAIEI